MRWAGCGCDYRGGGDRVWVLGGGWWDMVCVVGVWNRLWVWGGVWIIKYGGAGCEC